MPRLIEERDMPEVYELYLKHYRKYAVSYKMTLKELTQQLMPITGIVYTLVNQDPLSQKITEFISVYNYSQRVLNNNDFH